MGSSLNSFLFYMSHSPLNYMQFQECFWNLVQFFTKTWPLINTQTKSLPCKQPPPQRKAAKHAGSYMWTWLSEGDLYTAISSSKGDTGQCYGWLSATLCNFSTWENEKRSTEKKGSRNIHPKCHIWKQIALIIVCIIKICILPNNGRKNPALIISSLKGALSFDNIEKNSFINYTLLDALF